MDIALIAVLFLEGICPRSVPPSGGNLSKAPDLR